MARPRSRHLVRVAYVDTDQARVVHHSTYLRYLEQARVEFLREQGFDYAAWERATNTGLPVVDVRMRYLRPARFDDLLEITTWVHDGRRAWMWFHSEIRRDGALLTEGAVRVAAATLDGQIRRVPVEMLQLCLGDEYVE